MDHCSCWSPPGVPKPGRLAVAQHERRRQGGPRPLSGREQGGGPPSGRHLPPGRAGSRTRGRRVSLEPATAGSPRPCCRTDRRRRHGRCRRFLSAGPASRRWARRAAGGGGVVVAPVRAAGARRRRAGSAPDGTRRNSLRRRAVVVAASDARAAGRRGTSTRDGSPSRPRGRRARASPDSTTGWRKSAQCRGRRGRNPPGGRAAGRTGPWGPGRGLRDREPA